MKNQIRKFLLKKTTFIKNSLFNFSFPSLNKKMISPSAISSVLVKKSFCTVNEKKEETIDMEEIIQSKNTENKTFKAETKKLLDIVTHSLYTDKEIFLRELLSNCNDALEKQRYLETCGKLTMSGDPLYISITTNEKNKTLTIFDSGVGMTRDEMIDNLGTIAKSGTQSFLKEMKEKDGTESLIGQFGVGFYSSFIVGDQVEVISKTQNEEKASIWVSDGSGEYSISDVENNTFSRGTKIIIHLKPECRDFARGSEIIKIAKKHSNFISYGIKVNGEKINDVQAIWYRNKKDISKEEYQRFYEAVNSGSKLPFKYLLHFASDTPLDIKSIIFIPSTNSEKFGMADDNQGLSLYSKKILIKPKCQELLPRYLRFVRGIIDCSDIPLSISRESYQDSNLIFKLKTVITKRILKKLEEEMKNNSEEYDSWYEDFKSFLKEGILSQQESTDVLLRLQRFKCNIGSDKNISIDDYIEKMQKNQNKIYYYVSGEKDIKNSVFLQQLEGTDLPVLCSSNPVDEMIFKQIGNYKDFSFVNIENEKDDYLDKLKDSRGETINKIPEDDISAYTTWIKNELEPYVGKVTLSKRLTKTPILVSSETSANMNGFMAMMQSTDPELLLKNLSLDINPSHEIIIKLNELRKTDSKSASLIVKTLFDAGLCQSNLGILNKTFYQRTFNVAQKYIEMALNNKGASPDSIKVERMSSDEKSDDKFESLKVK